MKIFNIDTLTITGQGTLTITEGEDNTPIPVYEDVYISHNIAKVIEFLETPVKSVKGLPGEIKRIIMLIHLHKKENFKSCLVDLIYPKNFDKNSFTTIYKGNISFKVMLSVSKNRAIIKEVRVYHNAVQFHESEEYLQEMMTSLNNFKIVVEEFNNSIEAVFNHY